MRVALLKVAAVSVSLTLAATGVAWGHVVVTPESVPAGGYETLTVTVPTEKDIPTTKIRAEVPEGFTVSGVQPVPGWDYEFEEDGGVITAVTWSGGELRPREFQQFLLSAQAPENPGDYTWKAFQTYQDGSVVRWTGPPDAEEPAPVVEVVSSGSSRGAHRSGSPSETGSMGALPVSGGPVLALVLSAGALVAGAALLTLIRR
jgi:uncharacterized protein YcnI